MGGGSWGSGPPLPFGGPPNFIKGDKTLHVCARICHILILNIYLNPPPPHSFLNPVSTPAMHIYLHWGLVIDYREGKGLQNGEIVGQIGKVVISP